MGRQKGIIAFAVAVFLLSGLLLIYIQRLNPAATQATAIEVQLKTDEAQALRWLEQDSLWLKIARAPFASPTAPALPKNFSFSVFRDQSPVFWTDQHVFFPDPPHNPLAIAYPGRAPYYFIHRQVSKDFSVTAAVPLPGIVAAASPSTDYPIQNNSNRREYPGVEPGSFAFILAEASFAGSPVALYFHIFPCG